MKNNFHSINSHLLVLPLNVLKVVGWFLSVRAGFEIGKREEIGHLFLGKKLDRVKDEWDKAERGRRRKLNFGEIRGLNSGKERQKYTLLLTVGVQRHLVSVYGCRHPILEKEFLTNRPLQESYKRN